MAKNPFKEDPTRTATLRSRAVSEISRRYNQVDRLVRESIVTNKIFVDNARALDGRDFVFLRDPDKLARFDVWLDQILAELILQGTANPTSSELNWLLMYFKDAYARGVKKTNNNLANTVGRNQIPIRVDVFGIPYHIDRVAFLFSRDFTQLSGITEAVSQQLNLHLSQGLLQGQSPRTIAKTLSDRIDKIGKTRANLLARTEIINAHNLGAINEGKALEDIIGEEVVYAWDTSGDGKVRPDHIRRDNKYYSHDKVVTLIGEPNCRCSVTATPISHVPEGVTVTR